MSESGNAMEMVHVLQARWSLGLSVHGREPPLGKDQKDRLLLHHLDDDQRFLHRIVLHVLCYVVQC